jgi:opacity protein-like surface antigen
MYNKKLLMKSHLQSIYMCLLVFLPVFAQGQQAFHVNLNYAPSLPLGTFKDVTDGMSWRAWELNFLYQATSKFSIGLGGASQAYYKKYPQATLHESGRDITAVVNNAIELMPVMVKARYEWGGKLMRPFIGLGAGINLIRYDTYYGEFVDYNHEVQFAAQPEAGIHIPFTSTNKAGVNIGAGYNYMPFKNADVNTLNNVSFKAGLDLRLD